MIAYISFGSNLGNSVEILHSAFSALSTHSDILLKHRSSLYGSKPVGPQDQPNYVNAVAEIETSLEALALLDVLQCIESAHHRKRTGQRWGARTLDLDLLLYGNEAIQTDRLIVPHPRMLERSFVLFPLDEITNTLIFPDGSQLSDYLNRVKNDLWLLEPADYKV